MKPQVTKESLAQWIAELESQPHLSIKEERYLAVMKQLEALRKLYDEETNSECNWR